jgi:cytochrome c oxidase subunit 1
VHRQPTHRQAGPSTYSKSLDVWFNVVVSWVRPVWAGDNPWDAHTLEWATTSPPPAHNFRAIPPVRSERPVWDANHPEHVTAHP